MRYKFWYSFYKRLLFILQLFVFCFLQIPVRVPFSQLKFYVSSVGESLCFQLGELTSILDELEGEALLNTKHGGGAQPTIPRLV